MPLIVQKGMCARLHIDYAVATWQHELGRTDQESSRCPQRV